MHPNHGFRFGLEVEFLLTEADTYRPLWHPDLRFDVLHDALGSVRCDDLPPLDGLDLEMPHRTLMPFSIEGYHLPAPDLSPRELLPKGVEIRTPVCASIDECLRCLVILHERMILALGELGLAASLLSHHPIETHFEGPQNKRRYDYWQWAMQSMLTYGPDVNVSLPVDLNHHLDLAELHAKVNYYAPALTTLTLASPLYQGGLWTIRGRVGKSIRTYRRSVLAPAIEIHPHEGNRLEFKPLESTPSLLDLHGYFLLWLTLLLDEGLTGRASDTSRIYDLGAAARLGLEAEPIRDRASAVLDRAPVILKRWGFETEPLDRFRTRLQTGRLPADEIIDWFRDSNSIEAVLRRMGTLVCG